MSEAREIKVGLIDPNPWNAEKPLRKAGGVVMLGLPTLATQGGDMVSDIELGWLAGTLDGEGSIGIARRHTKGAGRLQAAVQMSTTCETTIERVTDIMGRLGSRSRTYGYQEKRPERHRNCWNLRCTRIVDIYVVSLAMHPISVTKREQWARMIEFCASRLDGVDVDERGRIVRGGPKQRQYNEREFEICAELSLLNRRGPR